MAGNALTKLVNTAVEQANAPPPPPLEFKPVSGPQEMAYNSTADVIGFGGAAGGGKSFLMLGLALTKHRRSVIFRREAMQLRQLIDDSRALIGDRGQFNENKGIWRALPGDRMLEFGGVQTEDDKKNWQGRAHDLKGFDEATEFTESQIRFLTAWNRTAIKGQKCTSILCFNPPTTPEGEWILKYFGPWIDPDYEGTPAAPGEIRWFAMVGGVEKEMPDERQFVVIGNEIVYDFEPSAFKPTEIIQPRSRTFIRAKVTDNPYLLATDYVATLQALDEPLRSQMLEGKFALREDENPFQLVPTDLVDKAQKAWRRELPDDAALVSLGVDVARGGKDELVIQPLYEGTRTGPDGKPYKVLHFAEQKVYPGVAIPNGQTARDLVVREWQNGVSINIDAIGVGSSPVDFLRESLESDLSSSDPRIVHAINNGAGAPKVKDRNGKMVPVKDKTGKFEFKNMRAFLAIRFREMMLDQSEYRIELPPSRNLRSDLTVPTWSIQTGKYCVEGKDDIKKRLPERRSTNNGDGLILSTANRSMPTKKKRKMKVWSF